MFLSLERRNTDPVLLQNPAQSRSQNTFPCVRSGALKHQSRLFTHNAIRFRQTKELLEGLTQPFILDFCTNRNSDKTVIKPLKIAAAPDHDAPVKHLL